MLLNLHLAVLGIDKVTYICINNVLTLHHFNVNLHCVHISSNKLIQIK